MATMATTTTSEATAPLHHHHGGSDEMANNVNNTIISIMQHRHLGPLNDAMCNHSHHTSRGAGSCSRESVLRRLSDTLLRRSLTKIDLSQRGLCASDSKLVKMALLQNVQLRVLKLGYNNLCDEGVRILCHGGISVHASLESLDLGFNDVGDDGCRELVNAIMSNPNNVIQTLYLAGNLLGEDAAMSIADLIRSQSSDDEVDVDVGCDVDDVVASSSSRCRLRRLYLTGNLLGPYGVKAIADAIGAQEKRRRRFGHLLDENMDEDVFNGMALGGADQDNEYGIREEEESHQAERINSPEEVGSESSVSSSSRLAGMRNGMNNLDSGSGMQELFMGSTGLGAAGCEGIASMLRCTRHLRVISLSNCGVDDELVKLLSASIKANKQSLPLRSLQLSFNQITASGMEDLVNSLWGSVTLRELLLDNNEIGDHGAQHFATVLPYLKSLETLNVGFNAIKSAGIKVLMKAVAETTGLLSMSLSGNSIDASAAKSVSYALAYNHSLTTVHLVHCSIEHEGQRHISAGIVSNSQLRLRELTGFQLGQVIVTLGFPGALEHWNNDQILNFIHLMWGDGSRNTSNYSQNKQDVVTPSEEEKKMDPLYVTDDEPLDGKGRGANGYRSQLYSSINGYNGTVINGKTLAQKERVEPVDAATVVEVAKKAFAALVADGVDVFSRRRPRHVSPLLAVGGGGGGDGASCQASTSSSSLAPSPNATYYGTGGNGGGDSSAGGDEFPSPEDDGIFYNIEDSPSESSLEPMPTYKTPSFVAPPETNKSSAPDPSRKKRIVEWLCSHIQHLNRLGQLAFSSADLWRLHQHYFTPVVNESGGNVGSAGSGSGGAIGTTFNSNGDTGISPSCPTVMMDDDPVVGIMISSVPEVSRTKSKNGNKRCFGVGIGDGDPSGAIVDKLATTVPASEPSMQGRTHGNGLSMLKRKVSYRFLGDAAHASSSSPTTSTKRQQQHIQQQSVSVMISGGPTYHTMPPKTKRARRNRSRISFLPRIKAKLDSYLDVCHEKALATMRQLYYVEQEILSGRVNPIDPSKTLRAHLCGDFAADAEIIIVDMI